MYSVKKEYFNIAEHKPWAQSSNRDNKVQNNAYAGYINIQLETDMQILHPT